MFNKLKSANYIVRVFERPLNFLFRKLGIKLKMSDLLRILLAKVIQSENYRSITTEGNVTLEAKRQPLPYAFDLSVYRKLNDDLAGLSDAELQAHYKRVGYQEGRLCSAIRSKNDFINTINNIKGKRLEIGPYMSPLLKKDADTYYSDYFSTDELKQEAAKDGRNPHIVVVVDFPTKGESLLTAVGENRFSVVVSCHCVEHVPCLITHFLEVSSIMSAGGYYFLIIPDKRFMADHYQETSRLPEVLAAHAENRKTTNIENTLKGIAFVTHGYPGRHWLDDHGDNPYNNVDKSIISALEQVKKYAQQGRYSDQHCWRFTPQSYEVIINYLNNIGLIDMKVERIFPTTFGSGEFYAVLQKQIRKNTPEIVMR